MKCKKKHRGVQGHALLYGRSSRAIRIVNGGNNVEVDKQHRSSHKYISPPKLVQKKYKMDERTERKLDSLKDPLDIMSRSERAQKYESAESADKYEYGLSDW
jgi:hypothetical protein